MFAPQSKRVADRAGLVVAVRSWGGKRQMAGFPKHATCSETWEAGCYHSLRSPMCFQAAAKRDPAREEGATMRRPCDSHL